MDIANKTYVDPLHPLAGVQILLVEDELDVATLLRLILNEAGADVTWVMQSNEALAYLQHCGPNILLSNIKLPDHNGDWLIQKIRQAELEKRQHLPAIALTSYTREFVAENLLKVGFDRFLPKDFDFEELTSTILELL